MGAKATFDIYTRTITLTSAPVAEGADMVADIDVAVDLYSDGKEDWKASETLRRLRFPIAAVGGQATPTGQLGATFFIENDWRIQPYNADHRLRINGNFYRRDGTTPFLSVPGKTIIIEQNVSALVYAAGASQTASAVWGADLTSYNTPATAGYVLSRISSWVRAILGMV